MIIKQLSETEFKVELEGITFNVTVDDSYYEKLTDGDYSKEQLIEASFKFLLDRESKESILKSFDLKVIERYFPEYPEKIKDYF